MIRTSHDGMDARVKSRTDMLTMKTSSQFCECVCFYGKISKVWKKLHAIQQEKFCPNAAAVTLRGKACVELARFDSIYKR